MIAGRLDEREKLLKQINNIIGFVDTPDNIRETAVHLRNLLLNSHISPRLIEKIKDILLDLEFEKHNITVRNIGDMFIFITETEKRYTL